MVRTIESQNLNEGLKAEKLVITGVALSSTPSYNDIRAAGSNIKSNVLGQVYWQASFLRLQKSGTGCLYVDK